MLLSGLSYFRILPDKAGIGTIRPKKCVTTRKEKPRQATRPTGATKTTRMESAMNQTILRRILGSALILLAAASMYLSWGALYEFALACGFPPERAILFPAVLDLVVVVALILTVTADAGRRSAFATLIVYGAFTIIGNAFHTTLLPDGIIQVPTVVAITASALPAISLIVVSHLAVGVFKKRPPVTTVAAEVTNLRPQVTQLHQDGHTLAHIARETGIPRSTVVRWIKAA
jgi:hypothetical protein